MKRQQIAIIGSGISGLTCAYLLHEQHEITVFESNDYIGGHTNTVEIEHLEQALQVDTGFIVSNDRNYANFLKLMSELGVALQPTEMSFSVTNKELNLEYNGHNVNTLFSQRRNFFRPNFYRLVFDILKFNKMSKALVGKDLDAQLTLGDFTRASNLSDTFKDNYLLPMVAAIWSCSLKQAEDFPIEFFLRFFHNHGLLDIKNRPQWYVVKGGSKAYIEPLTANFRQRIELKCPVTSVERTQSSITVNHAKGSSNFDQIIFACHSDQALALLSDPNEDEQTVLSGLSYQENDVILHHDDSLMPERKLAWASWNFLAGEQSANQPPIVTYCMNILQSLKSEIPLLVSLNARHKIDPEKILREFSYSHPVYSYQAIDSQSRRSEICGSDRIHYCGAYWYSGFHEDGVKSALDVASRFGKEL